MAQVSYGTITITDTTDLNTFIRYAKQLPLQSSSDFQLTPDTYTHYIAVLSIPSNEEEPSWNSNKWKWSEFIGTDGLSVKSTRILYYLKTNASDVPVVDNNTSIVSTNVQNAWTSINPTYVTNGTYWTCLEVTLSDNITKSWSTPVQDLGLTSSNATANNALTQATNASQAVSLMGGHFIYKSTSSGSSTPAGAGVIQSIADNPANWGYNTWIGANGIQLRRGETADATLNANGLILANGGIVAGTKGQTGYVYLSTTNHPVGTNGVTINGFTPTTSTEQWREIIGTNFGITNAGTLYASNVNIGGLISAIEGTIGGFTIGITNLYNGKTSLTGSTAGIFISTTGIAGGAGNSWWIKSDGTFQFGGTSGVRYDGSTLTVPAADVRGILSAAEINGANITGETITADKLNITNINSSGVLTITALSDESQEQILNSELAGDLSNKIDKATDSSDLLENINAVSDKINLVASNINFGNGTVADQLNELNSAVSIDTVNAIVTIGNTTNYHVKISSNELGFFQGAQRVAYINNNQLCINQSVVLQQMDLGRKYNEIDPITRETGLGQWSWKVHANTNGQNNLNLKWIG